MIFDNGLVFSNKDVLLFYAEIDIFIHEGLCSFLFT